MNDYPSGEWSPILVGHVWPNGANLTIITNAASNFASTAANYHRFSDRLEHARSGPLAIQQGRTVEDLREAFRRGENSAREVGEKNETKRASCQYAYDSASEMRSELAAIAEEGNNRIKKILESKEPIDAKIDSITDVVFDCQSRANGKAASCGSNILGSIQTVLDRDGIPKSSWQFAAEHGINTERMFGSPNKALIRDQVRAAVRPYSSPIPGKTDNLNPPEGLAGQQEPPMRIPGRTDDLRPPIGSPHIQQPVAIVPGQAANMRPPIAAVAGPPSGGSPFHLPGIAPPAQISTARLPNVSAPTAVSPATLPPRLTPSELLQSFDHGMQTGTPMSAATQALTGGPLNAIEPQLQTSTPHIPETAPVAPTPPSNAHVPVFDAPHPTHTPAAAPAPPTGAPPNEATTTYVAAPVGPAAPAPAAPAPTGQMPSYGADIRPPAPTASVLPTTPAGPPPTATAAAPTSSPAGTGGLGQPAVVRQTATPPAVSQTPAGVTEQALAAAGDAAVAGEASAAATAGARLQRLTDAVARQEPRLRWAVGERADGTSVLVTDLASGWIPPDINMPVGVQLLEPAHRRGDIEVLLGEVSAAASYTPVHYLPAEEEEPIATSARARHVPAINELCWELGQATKWRDELPRLAHTLAKAASTGTGVLDSEVELLREHLVEVRQQVLDSYPDHVNAHLVGNWQLLGAIDALVGGDTVGANYHFAWFRALSQATTAGRLE